MKLSPVAALPIRRVAGGFAEFTVTQRLPKIVAGVLAALSAQTDAQRRVERLLQDVMAGTDVDTGLLERVTPFWSDYIDTLQGASWAELPFFDIEFVFYHALNSIAGYFGNQTDLFKVTRREALRSALSKSLAAQGTDDLLAAALWGALLGNEADYSQFGPVRGTQAHWSERMVVDERPALLATLRDARTAQRAVHLILDNAGPELLADLALADAILSDSAKNQVVLHCKPWPMFVSDALLADVLTSVDALCAHGTSELAAQGSRLRRAMDSGRLRVGAHANWGEPRHFDNLDAALNGELQAAHVVISKGDLNYRRFVGDCAWPLDTSASFASGGVPFEAYALRVLKSDAVVGVPHDIALEAEARDASWRTNGSHALVQRLGSTQKR